MILAGTGHRPDKIQAGGLNAYDPQVFRRVVDLCAAAIRSLGPSIVISGGALGFDEALATAAVEAGTSLHLYLPFPGYDGRWPAESRARYAGVEARATLVKFVTPDEALPGSDLTPRPTLPYGVVAGLLHKRNRAMVDDCDMLVSLWDGGRKGGTWGCLQYAQKVGRPTKPLWQSWQRHSSAGMASEAPRGRRGGR